MLCKYIFTTYTKVAETEIKAKNGDLKFHLYDYQGYIGTYIIPHFFLAFIEEATKKQYKNACHF
jgi:hypothetical protein